LALPRTVPGRASSAEAQGSNVKLKQEWHGQAEAWTCTSTSKQFQAQAEAWIAQAQAEASNAIAKHKHNQAMPLPSRSNVMDKQCYGLDIVTMPNTSTVKPIMVLELGIARCLSLGLPSSSNVMDNGNAKLKSMMVLELGKASISTVNNMHAHRHESYLHSHLQCHLVDVNKRQGVD
jgi:hypothetical protein